MADYDCNRAGSGTPADASDKPLNVDAQQALDNAENASRLHQAANKVADKSRK